MPATWHLRLWLQHVAADAFGTAKPFALFSTPRYSQEGERKERHARASRVASSAGDRHHHIEGVLEFRRPGRRASPRALWRCTTGSARPASSACRTATAFRSSSRSATRRLRSRATAASRARRCRSWCGTRGGDVLLPPAHLVQAHRVLEALEDHVPAVGEQEALASSQLPHHVRDEDLSALGLVADASRELDGGPE